MWLSMPDAEIVAVADADEKGLAAELKKVKVGKGFADYRAMLAEAKPDIASIGHRHIDQHRDMVMACVEAGVKEFTLKSRSSGPSSRRTKSWPRARSTTSSSPSPTATATTPSCRSSRNS
jgi:hypothetical protein